MTITTKFPGYQVFLYYQNLDFSSVPVVFGKRICRDTMKESREVGYGIEVTEAQMEPWGKMVTPGNSYKEFEENANGYMAIAFLIKKKNL
jgi:hypothetical protein